MITFNNYKTVKLKKVAAWERARAGKVYPAGSTTIQISATRGQVGYLAEPGEVPAKDVVVQPQEWINPKYFNIVVNMGMDEFCHTHQTGLNIKQDEIGEMKIYLHNEETQAVLVEAMEQIEAQEEIINRELDAMKDIKTYLMDGMLI